MNKRSITNVIMAATAASTFSSCSLVDVDIARGGEIPILSKEKVRIDYTPKQIKSAEDAYKKGRASRTWDLLGDLGQKVIYDKGDDEFFDAFKKREFTEAQVYLSHDMGNNKQRDELHTMCEKYIDRKIDRNEKEKIIDLRIKPKGWAKRSYDRFENVGFDRNFNPGGTYKTKGWRFNWKLSKSTLLKGEAKVKVEAAYKF